MSRARWVWVVQPVYVYLRDAEARATDLRERFPETQFRVYGTTLRGYGIQRKETSQ